MKSHPGENDLRRLARISALLLNAAEGIETSRQILERAKAIASNIDDAELRHKVMAVAGELKASTDNFFS